jgi:hypothetical protein
LGQFAQAAVLGGKRGVLILKSRHIRFQQRGQLQFGCFIGYAVNGKRDLFNGDAAVGVFSPFPLLLLAIAVVLVRIPALTRAGIGLAGVAVRFIGFRESGYAEHNQQQNSRQHRKKRFERMLVTFFISNLLLSN